MAKQPKCGYPFEHGKHEIYEPLLGVVKCKGVK